MPVDYQ